MASPPRWSAALAFREPQQPLADSSSPPPQQQPQQPSSPQSPSPQQRSLSHHVAPHSDRTAAFSRTTSYSADPFSASAKAQPNAHPLFSKSVPHVKHPHPESPKRKPKKRSAPLSPSVVAPPDTMAMSSSSSSSSSSSPPPPGLDGSLRGPESRRHEIPATRALASSSAMRNRRPRSGDADPSRATLAGESATEASSDVDVLRDHFLADSSDDAEPRSDEHFPWTRAMRADTRGGGRPDPHAGPPTAGLGLGPAFEEPVSPSKSRSRAFVRSSSHADPFSAWQGLPDPGRAPRSRSDASSGAVPAAGLTSPSSQPRASQRRRLVGSSPKKLTLARGATSDESSSNASTGSDDDDDNVGPPALDWQALIDAVFEKGELNPNLDLQGAQISCIPPAIADLAKYVAIEPPRKEADSVPGARPSIRSSSSSHSGLAAGRANLRNETSSWSTTTPSPHLGAGALPTASASPRSSLRSPTASFSGSGFRRTDSGRMPGGLQVYLRDNQISRLPSALFQLHNLRVLSLARNRLRCLPAALGDLENLRELNVSNNELAYLPAEVQRLQLEVFNHFPNSWLRPPEDGKAEWRLWHSSRVLTSSAAAGEMRSQGRGLGDSEPRQATSSQRRATTTMGPPAMPVSTGRARTSERMDVDTDVTDDAGARGLAERRTEPLAAAVAGSTADARSSLAQRLFSSRISSFARRAEPPPTVEGDDEGAEDVVEEEATARAPAPARRRISPVLGRAPAPETSTPAAGGTERSDAAAVVRILGKLEVCKGGLPSLHELVLRKLLSPVDHGEAEAEEDGSASVACGASSSERNASTPRPASGVQVGGLGGTARRGLDSRTSSASQTFSTASSSSQAPATLLDEYENGTLRAVKRSLNRRDFVALESARRSAAKVWGSTVSVATTATTKSRRRSLAAARKKAGGGSTWFSDGNIEAWDQWQEEPGGGLPEAAGGGEGGTKRRATGFDAAGGAAEERPDRPAGATGAGAAAARRSRRAQRAIDDAEAALDVEGDDARLNPWHNRCPNPRHHACFLAAVSLAAAATQDHSDAATSASYPLASTASASVSAAGGSAQERLRRAWEEDVGVGAGAGALGVGADWPLGFPAATAASAQVGLGHDDDDDDGRDVDASHAVVGAEARVGQVQAHAPLFSQPVERRMEWVSHVGGVRVASKLVAPPPPPPTLAARAASPAVAAAVVPCEGLLPILWRGCSRGCLDFLR